MELIIITILSMQLRCEWRLESYQVALMSSVRKPTPLETSVKVTGRHHFLGVLAAGCVPGEGHQLPGLGDLL